VTDARPIIVATLNIDNYLGHGEEYVSKLKQGVAEHFSCIYGFYCLESKHYGLERHWNKMVLFEPGHFPDGSLIIYFDLDTIVHGSIDVLASYDGPFAALRDFYYPETIGTGVMLWVAGAETPRRIWSQFAENMGKAVAEHRSDQELIRSMERLPITINRLQAWYPGMFASYKADSIEARQQSQVVCYHGIPKPHETGWSL
jgi:hypothetical protein